MTKSACSKAFSLPELLDLFSSYLTPADLFACIRVNRMWNQFFIPKLWYTIDDNLQSWRKILFACHSDRNRSSVRIKLRNLGSSRIALGKDEAWIRGIFKKYGHHIRRLKLRWVILVDAASTSGVCTNLQDLEIDFDHSIAEHLYWSRKAKSASLTTTTIPAELQGSQFENVFKPPSTTGSLESDPWTEEDLEGGRIFTQLYWTLILANPGLRRLYLLKRAALQWPVESKEFIYKVFSGMKQLGDVFAYEFLDLAHMWRLHKAAPSVKTVTLWKALASEGHQSMAPEVGNGFILTNPSIKTLIFGKNPHHQVIRSRWSQPGDPSIQDVIMALMLLPNLEHLMLMGIRDHSGPEVQTFHGQGSSLTRLHVHVFHKLEPLLRHLPKLRELKVNYLSDEDFKVLATTCRNLEVLEWIQNPPYIDETTRKRPEHDVLHQFLVACPSLKVFDGIERFIKADDMIREPWACQGIEKLRCRIVGVERLTKDEQVIYNRMIEANPLCQDEAMAGLISTINGDEERSVMLKRRRSQEQQRRVYERLANLGQLKHLDLGYENRNPWTYKENIYVSAHDGQEYAHYKESPIPDTLELSLESGLDQLGALKDLELFGFEAIDHRIGKKELEWMAKSWPKLRLIYGLLDCLFMIEQDKKKLDLRKYMQALRPDVKHDTLFSDSV
ncbi:hypothetical protein BGX34_000072 [Mortierella sp. NVP85]|nr:hypothetical protein BGX34_000072 [Mortierella sp. NVP85]